MYLGANLDRLFFLYFSFQTIFAEKLFSLPSEEPVLLAMLECKAFMLAIRQLH